MVDRPLILDGSRVRAGDVLVGLPSAGLHTNGYSLARRILFDRHRLGLEDRLPGTDLAVRRALLAPHLSYLRTIEPILAHPGLHALAHITGGGLTDNLPRVLPQGVHGRIRLASWETPPLFRALRELGQVGLDEMLQVFNMGIGMVAVVDAAAASEISDRLDEAGGRPVAIGTVEAGGSGIVYA
jgi:phosphoribosylformylglycinamidine cyclo-ligase